RARLPPHRLSRHRRLWGRASRTRHVEPGCARRSSGWARRRRRTVRVGDRSQVRMSTLRFTPSQEAAISDVENTLQLIACAGSGKTQVLAERIARILAQPDVRPANVIAFTFTEKAAAELKE